MASHENQVWLGIDTTEGVHIFLNQTEMYIGKQVKLVQPNWYLNFIFNLSQFIQHLTKKNLH